MGMGRRALRLLLLQQLAQGVVSFTVAPAHRGRGMYGGGKGGSTTATTSRHRATSTGTARALFPNACESRATSSFSSSPSNSSRGRRRRRSSSAYSTKRYTEEELSGLPEAEVKAIAKAMGIKARGKYVVQSILDLQDVSGAGTSPGDGQGAGGGGDALGRAAGVAQLGRGTSLSPPPSSSPSSSLPTMNRERVRTAEEEGQVQEAMEEALTAVQARKAKATQEGQRRAKAAAVAAISEQYRRDQIKKKGVAAAASRDEGLLGSAMYPNEEEEQRQQQQRVGGYGDWAVEGEEAVSGAGASTQGPPEPVLEGLDFLKEGQHSYFATCAGGLEAVLERELKSRVVGASHVVRGARGCSFRGDRKVGYRALLWLRTALKVLELLEEQKEGVRSREDVFELVYEAVDWSTLLRPEGTLSVEMVLGANVAEGLRHTHFTSLTVKNAICDQFRDNTEGGVRPSVDRFNPDLHLLLYVHRGGAKLYRSLSGASSMHKRGYREEMHAAALKETFAAGLLLATGWDPMTQPLVDPMCGSATLAIEAALIARRIAPGLMALGGLKESGGTQGGPRAWKAAVGRWPDFDKKAWDEAVQEAQGAVLDKAPMPIVANDWHSGALRLAYGDASAAGVQQDITFYNENVATFRPALLEDEPPQQRTATQSPNMLVTNPPWDVRLENAEESWTALRAFLGGPGRGNDAWILSGNPELSRALRLRSSGQVSMSQGGATMRFLRYHLHKKSEGSQSSQARQTGHTRGADEDGQGVSVSQKRIDREEASAPVLDRGVDPFKAEFEGL